MTPAHNLELEQPLADECVEGDIAVMLGRGGLKPRLGERPRSSHWQHDSRSATHPLGLPGQASEGAYGF
jgi:hypothetical protein